MKNKLENGMIHAKTQKKHISKRFSYLIDLIIEIVFNILFLSVKCTRKMFENKIIDP